MTPSTFLRGLNRMARVAVALPEDANIVGAGFDQGAPNYIQVSGCINRIAEESGKEITVYRHGDFREYQVDISGITICQLLEASEEAAS